MQPESKLSRDIQKLIKFRGGYCWKVWGNDLTPAGTPDIVGCYKGRFIAVESKMPGNKPSTIQEYRMERMRIAGAKVIVAYNTAAVSAMLDEIDQDES